MNDARTTDPRLRAVATRLNLYFRSTWIGSARNCFLCDHVTYGDFKLTVVNAPTAEWERAVEFVEFCLDWNERTIGGPGDPSADEFDAFDDVTRDGCWAARSEDSAEFAIEDAPVFLSPTEVCFRLTVDAPS